MNKNLSEGNMGERNFQKGKNKLRIVAILAVAVILLVQGTFFTACCFSTIRMVRHHPMNITSALTNG